VSTVGVVVPVRGFAPYLAEALDSVLAQDRPPAVVVVVDDGSDPPAALHPDHAGRVRLVRRDVAGGPAAARATGLAALGGEFGLVALCDADDAWEPGKLAAQLRALQSAPAAVLCFGRALVVGADGRPTGEGWAEPAPGVHAASRGRSPSPRTGSCGCAWRARAGRRSASPPRASAIAAIPAG
jgi:glycosyltransferase involved in cell wall biosynthesis